MQNECFPDAQSGWPIGPISNLAKVNPRYLVDKRRSYPFREMAAVREKLGGIIEYGSRKPESSGLARFANSDTLFAKITPCPENGKIAFVKGMTGDVGLGSTEFIVLAPKENCNPRFLYHLLCDDRVRSRAIARMEGSIGRQRIPEDVFNTRLLVPMPPKREQEAIAQVLDAADAAIEQTRATVRQAEVAERSVLADLLSRGVGEAGSLRGESDHHVTSVGKLPADWEICRVGDEFYLQNGFTLNENRKPVHRKRQYLRVANVQRDALKLADVAELEAKDGEFALRELEVNDLLVVEGHADRMQIGRCARVTPEAAGMTFQNHLFRLRSKGRVDPSFGAVWLNSTYAQRYWNGQCATSSGLNTINQRMLKKMMIPVPPAREQERIVQVVQGIKAMITALKTKLTAQEALKAALLRDLLTGRVRVGAALPATAA